MTGSFAALVAAGGVVLHAAETVHTSRLWTGPGPGDGVAKEKERDLTKPEEGLIAGRRLIRLGHVWEPTLTVDKPAPDKDTGTSVLVCPGGGYHILALDLEGTEVCEWLKAVATDLPVSTNTPPTFIVMAQDDPVRPENAIGYAAELQRKKVPMELHLYPKGGHGYGLRRTELPVTAWPEVATEWMRQNRWLQRP